MQSFLERRTENYKKSLMSHYMTCCLIFGVMILGSSVRERYFELNFLVEIIFICSSLYFYALSFKNKNYTFWGVSFVLGLYLVKNLLQFTFIDYNVLVLYLSFLAATFLGVNAYLMASPLFYPRVQWWEYDFRYKGDLKVEVDFEDEKKPGRLIDFRRSSAAIEMFEFVELGSDFTFSLTYGQSSFAFTGTVQTLRTIIPGRPIRYGVSLDLSTPEKKDAYLKMKKIWSMNNKVKLRRKFSDIKEKA